MSLCLGGERIPYTSSPTLGLELACVETSLITQCFKDLNGFPYSFFKRGALEVPDFRLQVTVVEVCGAGNFVFHVGDQAFSRGNDLLDGLDDLVYMDQRSTQVVGFGSGKGCFAAADKRFGHIVDELHIGAAAILDDKSTAQKRRFDCLGGI